jgi:putative oxidoreductase
VSASRALTAAARWLSASAFLIHGLEQVADPGPERIEAARAINTPRPEAAVRLNGTAMVLAGLMLALGYRSRTGAAILAASMVPTTLAGHPYWRHDAVRDADGRAEMRIHFIKNASLTGTLALIALSRGQAARNG